MEHYRFYHKEIPDLIEALAETPPMQRLKDIGMNCGCEYTAFPRFAGLKPYSRYDHSVGAALIVYHFSRDIRQSAAALLHDVASPVFAHVVDFMKGDYLKQEATEEGTKKIIEDSGEIQELLRRYGLKTEEVCDYHRYPLADNDPPKLSADRLEYTLGNIINYRILDEDEVFGLYQDLIVHSNEEGEEEIAFQSKEKALSFGLAALECSRIYTADEDRYAMQILSEILKQALERKTIDGKDLYVIETEVIGKMKSDPFCLEKWNELLSFQKTVRSEEKGKEGKQRKIFAKKRYIDPLVRNKGRLSGLSPIFSENLRGYLEESQDCWICAE